MITTEGTLYLLLGRLRRDRLVETHWQQSQSVPPRRCSRLTARGTAALERVHGGMEAVLGSGRLDARDGAPMSAEQVVGEYLRRPERAAAGLPLDRRGRAPLVVPRLRPTAKFFGTLVPPGGLSAAAASPAASCWPSS
jgi:hypothetical protein